MLSQLLENQGRLFETQAQINSGKKANEYSGLSGEAQTLLGAKSVLTRTEGYLNTLSDVKGKLDTNNLYLESVYSAGADMKQVIVEALAQDQTLAFEESLEQAVTMVLSALNTEVNGSYIFAGQRTDTQPVAANNMADLLAAPSAASLFQNDNNHLTSRVNDNVDIKHGILASEAGQDLLTSLKALVDFNAGPLGPLDGPLTAAQRSFLETEMANVGSALESVQSHISQNGLRQQRVDTLEKELESNTDFLKVFISDIEDVDITEAITRLNNDQTALEASYRVVAQLSNLSLVDFI
jgi:flagellar hook-associated protein 3 FlgL